MGSKFPQPPPTDGSEAKPSAPPPQSREDRYKVILRRVAVLVGRIKIGGVDVHVGTGDPHYESHVPCDDWCELEALLDPFRNRVPG